MDQITGDNRANFLLFSNHRDALRDLVNERRYAIFFSAQQTKEDLTFWGMDGEYFPDLYDWAEGRHAYGGQPAGWSIIAHWLSSYSIPARLNPARLAQRAPDTTSRAQAIEESRGALEQAIVEEIAKGSPGFAGGWLSGAALDKLIERAGMSTRISISRRRKIAESLGFVVHPGLPGGRAPGLVMGDGGFRPLIYIKAGSPVIQAGPDQIMGQFNHAQGYR